MYASNFEKIYVRVGGRGGGGIKDKRYKKKPGQPRVLSIINKTPRAVCR